MIDLRNKTLPNTISVNGKVFSIYTDYRIWLKVSELIKTNCTLKDLAFIFKNDMPLVDFSTQIIEFLTNENSTPSKTTGTDEVLLDYIQDGEYIYASFMSEYNIDLIDINELHWHKFKALFISLSDDSMIKQIMQFRGYKRSNKKQEDLYLERKKAWQLPTRTKQETQEILEELNDLFYNC